MRILWLTNFTPADICKALGRPSNNKEGWISGLMAALRENEDGIELYIAAPTVEKNGYSKVGEFDGVTFYEYFESPDSENYHKELEKMLFNMAYEISPDIIHIFGTEYPHTRAMLEGIAKYGEGSVLSTDRVLIGYQGVCGEIAKHYLDGVPEDVARKSSLRDILKKDGLIAQRDKFVKRAENEKAALKLAKHITGRTDFDRKYTEEVAPDATYYFMNETLRPEFYEGKWNEEDADKYTIFLSQANYPVKGMHYFLEAYPRICERFPEVKIKVAGDPITRHATLKERLKLQNYARYLLDLEDNVEKLTGKRPDIEYLGSLDAQGMKEQYLKAGLFVNPSIIENSPNSIGEAMLLGVPVISSAVGGVPSMLSNGEEGLLYEADDIDRLINCIGIMWTDSDARKTMCEAAIVRASKTHDPKTNYSRLLEIYDCMLKEKNNE